MARTKITVLFALVTLSISFAFTTIIPWEKELIYNWTALVQAGTHFPANFASQFILDGKVHIQAKNNITYIKLIDLTYKLYNGILHRKKKHEAHSVPVPQEIQDIQNVFKVVYNSNGQVVGITTEHQEKEFSRNIKRAVASVFQIHDSVVKEHHKHPRAFVTHEHSIHGYGKENYNVFQRDDGTVEVHKMYHMRNSQPLYKHAFNNDEESYCNANTDDPVMYGSFKKYVITKEDGNHIVKHIEVDEIITYYPFEAKSVGQYIVTNQTFELVRVVPIQEQFHVQQEHYDNHLAYYAFDDAQHETTPDVTNGRHTINYEKLVPQVKRALEDVNEYLHKDHIHTKEPDTKRVEAVNRAQRLLIQFNLEKLKELHESLSGEILRIYHHILPLVGSRASVLFVKHLIVNKVVDESTAVQMMQHFPEHVMIPSIDLLEELEDLMHLNNGTHWNIRRVAILSFASLIHKSHKYYIKLMQRQQQDDALKEKKYDLQQPYEKYVVEYIDKIKNSRDYKEQMTYTIALFNMKLRSISKHMIPALNGDWWYNRHLQFISVIATAPSLLLNQDSNTIFETYWPIVTNREEHMEVRMLAYFFTMESQPALSTLKNIFWFILTEPNEEFYSYHYTYVHSMMQSTDPCRQETRVKMAQMMKFMPPPSHGQSSSSIYDYRDLGFGFSASVQTYYIKTEVAHLWGGIFTSQQNKIFHDDYKFYLKIHGIKEFAHKKLNWLDILTNVMRKKIMDNKNIHIELAICRHDHFINTYFFNADNLPELLNLFTQNPFSQDLLYISYSKYHRAIIPTNLGIPALWEYMMPMVDHLNVSVAQAEVGTKLNIDCKYINWINHRHGLSFYNPLADVWQGVNSYHVYDAVLPVHLNIVFDGNSSLQISWKKSDDSSKNVIGLRSHFKQITFVKDDYQRNILGQSSPYAMEWETVSKGKGYRNEHVLLDEDDLTTGHKWYMNKYDCDYHVSNSSIGRHLQYFTQTFSKNIDSLSSHMLMSYLNFHHYTILSPTEGTCGLILRVEPSQKYDVSDIHLLLQLQEETTEKEKYHYTFGQKLRTRLTYDVKNKEQSLKKWDVSASLNMNPGHTINNFKMVIIQIISGQSSYKICVDGVKKWDQKKVSGHITIRMNQSSEEKCTADDNIVEVTMTGIKSHAQNHEHHIYAPCRYIIPYSDVHFKRLQCLASHTTVREYNYNVKTSNVPLELKKSVGRWWNRISAYYMSHFTEQEQHNADLDENSFNINVVYPMEQNKMEFHITTPNYVYDFTDIPIKYWQINLLMPDSLYYASRFLHAHSIEDTDHCVVFHDHHYLMNSDYVHEVVTNDWKLYVGDNAENPHKAVYIKHAADDKIAVKVLDQEHSLEMIPLGDAYQVSVDGKIVTNEQNQHQEDWVSLLMFDDDDQFVAATLQMSGFHLEYDGHQVVIIIPNSENYNHWHGKCYVANRRDHE